MIKRTNCLRVDHRVSYIWIILLISRHSIYFHKHIGSANIESHDNTQPLFKYIEKA